MEVIGVFGNEGFFVGGEFVFDIVFGFFIKYNVGVGFVKFDFNVFLML